MLLHNFPGRQSFVTHWPAFLAAFISAPQEAVLSGSLTPAWEAVINMIEGAVWEINTENKKALVQTKKIVSGGVE